MGVKKKHLSQHQNSNDKPYNAELLELENNSKNVKAK